MNPDDFNRQFGAQPATLRAIAYLFATLSLFLLAENVRLRSLDGPLAFDDAPMRHIRNERFKLLATYLNTIAGGLAVTGVIGPIATYLYGTSATTTHPAWQIGLEIVILLASSGALHGLAQVVLGRLEP